MYTRTGFGVNPPFRTGAEADALRRHHKVGATFEVGNAARGSGRDVLTAAAGTVDDSQAVR